MENTNSKFYVQRPIHFIVPAASRFHALIARSRLCNPWTVFLSESKMYLEGGGVLWRVMWPTNSASPVCRRWARGGASHSRQRSLKKKPNACRLHRRPITISARSPPPVPSVLSSPLSVASPSCTSPTQVSHHCWSAPPTRFAALVRCPHPTSFCYGFAGPPAAAPAAVWRA